MNIYNKAKSTTLLVCATLAHSFPLPFCLQAAFSRKIASVTEMNCSSKSIASLKGIEYFTALTMLYCDGNQLTTLDVSGCTALKGLRCDGNQLTTLDLSKNTALKNLFCWDNQLTSLDVSMNTELTMLYCNGNQLTSLDLSKNTALKHLYCYKNKIRGDQMTALVNSLPDRSAESEQGSLCIYNNETSDGNMITTSQVAVATAKNRKVQKYEGNEWVDYAGEETAVNAVTADTAADGVWYTLDGRKLNSRPHKKGLYIHNGRRIVVK